MKIGFYAPLKSPTHPTPSGDRMIANLFIDAFRLCNHQVEELSTLRSWQKKGDRNEQGKIKQLAMDEVERLKQFYKTNRKPDLIFTYHIYHKAPDWIGIELADYFNIPYVVAEASLAPKQAGGNWSLGHEQTIRCLKSASKIIALNPIDINCTLPYVRSSNDIHLIKPFIKDPLDEAIDLSLNRPYLANKFSLDIKTPWLITVAMMRKGDKSASYKCLAQTLQHLNDHPWQAIVIGDGDARTDIKGYFSTLKKKVLFTGQLDNSQISQWLNAADLFVWPAINEALGLAILQAQAHGLAVVAQNHGGVSSIIRHNYSGLLSDASDQIQFTQHVKQLLSNHHLRETLANNARIKFIKEHEFNQVANVINKIISQVISK